MKELGRKLLLENFSRILMTQVDAQFKNKRDRRYDPEFKKFALSLYFFKFTNLSRIAKIYIALPSTFFNLFIYKKMEYYTGCISLNPLFAHRWH